MHVRTRRTTRTFATASAAIALLLPTTLSSPAAAAVEQAAGSGAVTAEMQAEIDRVVDEGRRTAVSARASAQQQAAAHTRCATFEEQRYCLGVGWTTSTEEEAASRLAAAASAPSRTRAEKTGDLDPLEAMRQRSRMSPDVRADAERAELTEAARSVAKVWLIRHEIQGVPLPDGFAQDHPEAAPAIAARESAAAYPEKFTILKQKQVRPQNRTYYCGPATMQMIAWGWKGHRKGQAQWADQLGTTSAGTSITDMVRVVNRTTGYDREDHAGDYIVLDIADFSFDEWWRLMRKHVYKYEAPVVLHPVLLKQYFPYLDDDASGHFQVGRGFDETGGKPLLGYFEPWDQSRFNPTEPRIARTQWQSAYKSYRANQAHFQHNVGL